MRKCFSFISISSFLILSFFFLPNAKASPIDSFERGNGKIGVYSTLGEKSNLNGVVLDNGGNIRFDGYYSLGKKWAIGLRHKQIDVEKGIQRTILGKTYGTTVDGNLKETDLLFLFNLLGANNKKLPQVSMYFGAKRLEGTLNGKEISGSITIGKKTYSGTARIEPKHKVVVGPSIGFTMTYPVAKMTDVWADLHFMHYINGFEAGINQKITNNIGIDASYFYDKYRYNDYHMTDKGFRLGLTFALNGKRKKNHNL